MLKPCATQISLFDPVCEAVPPAMLLALLTKPERNFCVCMWAMPAESLTLCTCKLCRECAADILQLALAHTHSVAADRSQQPNGDETVGSQAGLPGSEPPDAHNHPSLPLYELQL